MDGFCQQMQQKFLNSVKKSILLFHFSEKRNIFASNFVTNIYV